MKRRMGFTLIEMLTVVVIIGILATITMRLMVYVNEKTGKTRAARDIEQIKHALTEYHSVYGIYPPANRMSWEYENSKYAPSAPPDGGLELYDGLATYLFNDSQASRWAHFLEGLKATDLVGHKGENAGYGQLTWSNNYASIKDPWERDYKYNSTDPYQGFKLFSMGPDGKENTADDIGNRWTE